jgi:hypothetical protein
VFIVVKAHSGVFEVAEAFRKESAALKRAKFLSRGMNPDYDEVEVFHSRIKGQA